MASEVYMDVPAVRGIAKTFDNISDVLHGVAKVLETLATILKTTAFIGLVGGAALLLIIENIKPYVEEIAEKCAELHKDLNASIDAFEQGDQLGATRFY